MRYRQLKGYTIYRLPTDLTCIKLNNAQALTF